ncbi:MAG: hypothetical protein AABY54_01940 [Deltaproteobacteria bacterium]
MKNRYFITYGLLIAGLLSLWGCSSGSFTAPSGSTMTVNPSSISESISADTTHNFTVTVSDADGKPLNGAEVFITGAFAAPRTVARYQFYRDVGAVTSVNSGFSGKTDEFGNYYFSIVVPATVGGAANVFTDTIDVRSGAAFISISITLS